MNSFDVSSVDFYVLSCLFKGLSEQFTKLANSKSKYRILNIQFILTEVDQNADCG